MARVDFRAEFLDRLRYADRGNRAMDWRVYAHSENRDVVCRLGSPGQWAIEEVEDREFRRLARVHGVPRYTTSVAAAKLIRDAEVRGLVLDLLRGR